MFYINLGKIYSLYFLVVFIYMFIETEKQSNLLV